MSIITEALKRAEQDKRRRALEAAEEVDVRENSEERIPPEVHITNVTQIPIVDSEAKTVDVSNTGSDNVTSGTYHYSIQNPKRSPFFVLAVFLGAVGVLIVLGSMLTLVPGWMNTSTETISSSMSVSAPSPASELSIPKPIVDKITSNLDIEIPASPKPVTASAPAVNRNVKITPAPVTMKSILNIRPTFKLTGITASTGDKYAIINGTIVQENDMIEGAQVKTITEKEVTLKGKLGDIKLTLPK